MTAMARFTMPETLPEGEEKVEAVRSMFDAIAPRYDLVNRIMTFRMDVRWRRRTVASLGLPGGADGDRPGLRHRRPLPRAVGDSGLAPIGVDLSYGMLAAARTDAPLVHGDALRLPLPDASVDGVTCGFALRNFESLPPFFAELARIVRPGGRIALLEVAEPPNRVLRWGHGDLLRQGRAARRRAAVRPRGLPLPAPLGRLPAGARP